MDQIATGSGIFISPNGKLVTNSHVIEGYSTVRAKLSSGAYYVLKGVVGASKRHDLAILQFEANDVPYVRIKKIDKVTIGESVFTIGSPLGLEKTVTEGIISNPERKDGDIELIQFTAPISSGNSGGGLFNQKGIILGITSNTILPTRTDEAVQNINFAVPIKYVEKASTGNDIEFTENSPDYFYSEGVIYNNKKEYDKAEESFKSAIQTDSQYANAYIDLGDVYYKTGKCEEEVNVLLYAQKLMPNNPDVNFSLATAYEDISEYRLAIETYEKVLKYRPDDKDALDNVCLLYIIIGQNRNAIEHIKQLSKLDVGMSNELDILVKRTSK